MGGLGFGVWGSEFAVRSLGFGVLCGDLKGTASVEICEICGSGFGVWGSGLEVDYKLYGASKGILKGSSVEKFPILQP
jgi:hypothetical protein